MTYLLPLFPLPDTVLFPRTHLPLHIFEPRYRLMIEAVLKGDRRLGMAHLREGYQENYFGAPPVYRVLTAARVLFADPLKDGRWNILIEGIERVELQEEVQIEPFRIARVKSITEDLGEANRDEIRELTQQLAEQAEQLGQALGDDNRRILTNLVNTHRHPAIVCDLVAAVLVTDPYARQSILDERDVLRRLQLASVQVQLLAQVLRENA